MSHHSSAIHDTKLAAIKAWFEQLEPGIAELQIETVPEDTGYTHVHIRPRRTPDAAEILLRVSQEEGWVFLYSEGIMDDLPDDWPDLTFLEACEAIMAGRLTATMRLWRGQEIVRTTCLHMPGEEKPYCHQRSYGCSDLIILPIGTLLGRMEKRIVHYPPY